VTDIIAFLKARIANDEYDARALLADPDVADVWEESSTGVLQTGAVDAADQFAGRWLTGNTRLARHIVRWQPARALREAEARRLILGEHRPAGPGSAWCYRCDPAAGMDDRAACYPCLTIRCLAAVSSDHPDYDPVWAIPEEAGAADL